MGVVEEVILFGLEVYVGVVYDVVLFHEFLWIVYKNGAFTCNRTLFNINWNLQVKMSLLDVFI
jgi:hypothetical protein